MPTAKIVYNQWNGVLNWRSINYKLHRFSNFKRIEVRSPLTTLYWPGSCIHFDMTTNVALSDQYVLLLQNVVEENRLLREQLSNTVTNNENALKDIKTQMDILARTNTGSRRARQTGQNKQNVPKACSVSKTFLK